MEGNAEKKEVDINTIFEFQWTYYQLHAEQRMKILELFVTIEIVLFGGYILMLSQNSNLSFIASVAVSIVASICYSMDKRTSELLHYCREAMRKIEEEFMKNYDKDIHMLTRIKLADENEIPYSKIISFIYVFVAVVGIVSIFWI